MAVAIPEYTVRREFTAAGRLLPKGTRLVDPQWPNVKALVEVGYLAPALAAVLPAPAAAKTATQDTQRAQPATAKAKNKKGA